MSRLESRLRIVARFASALDDEDYGTAGDLLSEGCSYCCRGMRYRGRAAILESYQSNGAAAKSFDEVAYASTVVSETNDRFRIQFSDRLTHAGRTFTFRCEQLVPLDDSEMIVEIQHVDLPGQPEALAEFKRLLDVPQD